VSDVSDAALRGAAGAQVEAQAKINLRLRILAREESGYHQLETLFMRLGLADTVRLQRTTGVRCLNVTGDVDVDRIGPPARNLAWRAAEAYLAAAKMDGGFAIELEKRIPIGGGLGGGSADAGAVLRLLEAIAPTPIGEARLMAIAASLGADVPVLASEHAYALAWGRGERVLALEAPERRPIVLFVPPFSINTTEAYAWLSDARRTGGPGQAMDPAVLDLGALRDWDRLSVLAINDFEAVVGARHPEIPQAVSFLMSMGCDPAMMSGSGSVVFGVLPRNASVDLRLEGGGRIVDTFSATAVERVRLLD
jgi:4-diphosphocytidyl-2-C-methyl-D-erythritol kinase